MNTSSVLMRQILDKPKRLLFEIAATHCSLSQRREVAMSPNCRPVVDPHALYVRRLY